MTIRVSRRARGFIASADGSGQGKPAVSIRQPVSPLVLMHHLCSVGYDQHEVAVAILEADPDAFEDTAGLDWGLE